jgi:hypothetical protein
MNKQEATRIAGAINALRPDWGVSGLMSILGDDRLRNRAYEDMTRTFVALALDPKSAKPTRVFEDGPWWHVTTLGRRERNTSSNIRHAAPTDCDICGFPADRHVVASLNDHDYRPRNASGHGTTAPEGLIR